MTTNGVRRRCVFFISGFDPKGPNWYHGTYRRQAAAQSKLSGMSIQVGPRRSVEEHFAAWSVEAAEAGHAVEVDYLFLRWDDIIRQNWPKGTWRMCRLATDNLKNYLRSGVLWRVFKTAWPTFICAVYPTLILLGTAILLMFLAAVSALSLSQLTHVNIWVFCVPGLAAIAIAWLFLVPRLDKRFAVHWLTRIYAFTLIQARSGPPELDERLGKFAEKLVTAVREDHYDEVMVVGHSTGGQSAVSMLAKALQQAPDLTSGKTAVSFLTLGSSIPMLGWQPDAQWFRDDLHRVVHSQGLTWLDFSAAQDGACFALRNQAALTLGVDEASLPDMPKVLSIKLFELFSEKTFGQLRHDFLRVHFQYLKAGEALTDYDYFAITAGAKTLADRFHNHKSTMNFDRFESRLFRP